MCVHDTDARGLCTKNGAHCAFAHGAPDLRPPVLDVRELQALENPDAADGDAAAPNALDRERNLMNEDPKWQGKGSTLLLPNSIAFVNFFMVYLCIVDGTLKSLSSKFM